MTTITNESISEDVPQVVAANDETDGKPPRISRERREAALDAWHAGERSAAEIADEAGITVGALHQVFHRARKAGDPRAALRKVRRQ